MERHDIAAPFWMLIGLLAYALALAHCSPHHAHAQTVRSSIEVRDVARVLVHEGGWSNEREHRALLGVLRVRAHRWHRSLGEAARLSSPHATGAVDPLTARNVWVSGLGWGAAPPRWFPQLHRWPTYRSRWLAVLRWTERAVTRGFEPVCVGADDWGASDCERCERLALATHRRRLDCPTRNVFYAPRSTP